MIEVACLDSLSKRTQKELQKLLVSAYGNSPDMQLVYGSNNATLKRLFRMTISIYNVHKDGRFYIVYKDNCPVAVMAYSVGDIAQNKTLLQLKNGLMQLLFTAGIKRIRQILRNTSVQKQFQKKYYNPRTDVFGSFLAIDPAHQNNPAIGRKLMMQIISDFKGKKNIYLETISKRAKKIYEGIGFTVLETQQSSVTEISAMKLILNHV